MTMAVTKVECYGVGTEEAVNKRYRQYMNLTITGANTDVDYDFGDHVSGSLGTFWDAVDGTTIGANALTAIRDIVKRAAHFNDFGGDFKSRSQADAAATLISYYDSAVSAGGNATETMTVTGLLTTDTILSVDQVVDGAGAGVAILSWGTAGAAAADNALSVVWNADPGAGAKVRVHIKRAAGLTAVEAGSYQVAYGTKAPNILFASGDAPTTMNISLEWVLNPSHAPVEHYATA